MSVVDQIFHLCVVVLYHIHKKINQIKLCKCNYFCQESVCKMKTLKQEKSISKFDSFVNSFVSYFAKMMILF